MYTAPSLACFGEKLGIGYLKGGEENEFSAHIVAIYIKEKTGIDSVINKYSNLYSAEGSQKGDKTDIIILIGKADELDIEKLGKEKDNCSFFTLIDAAGRKVILQVSKKRLADMKFFTVNKVMKRIHKVISVDDFNKWVAKVKSGDKFSKQAAREYLLEKDMI